MFRKDFQILARIRIQDARILLKNGQWGGAYHLTGVAVECAIKAAIAKQTARYSFPQRNAPKCYDHDLTKLIELAGLTSKLDAESKKTTTSFGANWGFVKDWKVESRYDQAITETMARGIYTAVTARRFGVLSWLRQHW